MKALITLMLITLAIAPGAGDTPVYLAPRVPDPPVLDGVLDDACWAAAPVATDFVLNDTHAPAQNPTEVRLVYDAEALYVAFICHEPHLDRLAIQDLSDNLWWGDCVEVFVDPMASRVRYFQYLVDARAAMDTSYTGDFAADIGGEAAAGRTEGAWTVEMRLPFSAFGHVPALGERWGLNLTRARPAKAEGEDREQSLWTPTDGGHGSPGKFGTLVFSSRPGTATPRPEPDRAVMRRLLDRIAQEAAGEWRWTDEDVNFTARSERAERLLALNRLLALYPDTRLIPFVRPAIRDEHLLPWTVPAAGEIGHEIRLTACRGEFESATVGLFAATDLGAVTMEHSDLIAADGSVMPATIADLCHVISWYQSGTGTIFRSRRTLVSELLMKNPALVTVDPAARENLLAFDAIPRDATRLQPVAIPAFETRPLWITYRIPRNAAAGTYRGTITIRDGEHTLGEVPVLLRIPEWDLAPSPMWHGLYYGLRIPHIQTVEEEDAFFRLFEAEIRHQIEHGCNMVATYMATVPLPSDPSPFASADRLHRIQAEYGIAGTPYVCIVSQIGFQPAEELEALTALSRRMNEWAKSRGYENFYFHGMDEASGDRLAAERASFEAARAGGSGVFVACRPSFFDIVGGVLNLPNVTGRLLPELAERVHEAGGRILSYGNPQAGIEQPVVYRRNYGLALRAAGYDGSMNYEYRTVDVRHAWDDFDEDSYRDHNFAYPAEDRPIGTIQFAGWREGIDDVRYARTLELAAERADPALDAEALDAIAWLDALTGYEDLEAVRAELIRRIDALSQRRE